MTAAVYGPVTLAACDHRYPTPPTVKDRRGRLVVLDVYCTRPAGHPGPHQHAHWNRPVDTVWPADPTPAKGRKARKGARTDG